MYRVSTEPPAPMNRSRFLETSAALLAGGLLSPLLGCEGTTRPVRRNWAGNYPYKAPHLLQPKTVAELQTLLKKAGKHKALGTGYSYNDVADNVENQISTQHFNQILALDAEAMTVTVGAGMRYAELTPLLHQKGYALHNLPAVLGMTVGGACATATHGSGLRNGNMATAVVALDLVTPTGEAIHLSREADPDLFKGAVVGLGALGVITSLMLAIQPTYLMRQDVFQNLPLEALLAHYDEIMATGYSLSLFTNWQQKRFDQVWVKRRVEAGTGTLGTSFFGATAATQPLHPVGNLRPDACTPQLGSIGPWHERLPHYRPQAAAPAGAQPVQSEYFVPYQNGPDVLLALMKLGNRLAPHLLVSEVRTVAADRFWMSPCHRQDCLAIQFTWKPDDLNGVKQLLPDLEAELAPFAARPHWATLFKTTPAVLKERYEMLPEFLQLARLYDPYGKCRNEFLDMNVFAR